MRACSGWLAVDWFVRAGFTLHADPDGNRWVSRPGLVSPVDPPCGHNPEDCPPHPTVIRRDIAA